jgi:hypothetical protein
LSITQISMAVDIARVCPFASTTLKPPPRGLNGPWWESGHCQLERVFSVALWRKLQ